MADTKVRPVGIDGAGSSPASVMKSLHPDAPATLRARILKSQSVAASKVVMV